MLRAGLALCFAGVKLLQHALAFVFASSSDYFGEEKRGSEWDPHRLGEIMHARRLLYLLPTLLLVVCVPSSLLGQQKLTLDFPKPVLSEVPFELRASVVDSSGQRVPGRVVVRLTGFRVCDRRGETAVLDSLVVHNGVARVQDVVLLGAGRHHVVGKMSGAEVRQEAFVLPGWVSLLPPLLAIGLALWARQVIVALFAGVWLGATFVFDLNPLAGLLHALDHYLIQALADPDHAAIVMFSMTLGGMVGVISKAGGTQGIVELVSRWAKGRRGAQLATWALGVFIFFDDYANTLVVGNTMRPFTDRMRVSREKLSYIVDSTAAPVASVALISTWVGFQVGLIDSAFEAIGFHTDAYVTFLRSIPYSFYSILAIVFVALVGWMLRDFGAMWKAEHRAVHHGKALRDGAQPISDAAALDGVSGDDVPLRWLNAVLPVGTMIVVTIGGLYVSGRLALGAQAAGARLGEIFGAADSFDVLMWASFTAALTAILLAVGQRILSLGKALEAWLTGARAMVLAMVILVLAWSIGKVCQDLHTADFVIHWAGKFLSARLLPVLTFVVAAFVSFSTGTSWATMAILIPIVVPMADKLASAQGLAAGPTDTVLLGTIGAVLSGSVFGDHCSPISDTTIMSSMASAADHIDHVRTQMPYALLVAAVAALLGYVPAAFGLSPVVGIVGGTLVLAAFLRFVGKPV